MPSDAQFRTLLKDKDTATLNRMERDRSYTTEQWAMIAEEIRSRHTMTAAPNTLPPTSVLAGPKGPLPVRITDVDMPFGSMVAFMVKWALASIPAFLILTVLGIVLVVFLAALGLTLRPPTV